MFFVFYFLFIHINNLFGDKSRKTRYKDSSFDVWKKIGN